MKCNKIREWISLEMDDQLDHEHVATLDDHLQACADCREYRHELSLGARFLMATAPDVPADFEWKLQLRLSRAMREAAAEAHPWRESQRGWRRWMTRAVPSAAVGLAAVLTVALLLPTDSGEVAATASLGGNPALRLPTDTDDVPAYLGETRRPLADRGSRFGERLGQPASSNGGLAAFSLRSGDEAALQRIRHLEQDNQTLRRRLFAKDRQIHYLQAQLDSLAKGIVDTR